MNVTMEVRGDNFGWIEQYQKCESRFIDSPSISYSKIEHSMQGYENPNFS